MKPPMKRCADCGQPTREATCYHHPDALMVEWGQSRRIAYYYVCVQAEREGLAGADLDVWVETYDEIMWPGTNRGDMALALSYARTWRRRDEFKETGLPEIRQPITLYGRKTGATV